MNTPTQYNFLNAKAVPESQLWVLTGSVQVKTDKVQKNAKRDNNTTHLILKEVRINVPTYDLPLGKNKPKGK